MVRPYNDVSFNNNKNEELTNAIAWVNSVLTKASHKKHILSKTSRTYNSMETENRFVLDGN